MEIADESSFAAGARRDLRDLRDLRAARDTCAACHRGCGLQPLNVSICAVCQTHRRAAFAKLRGAAQRGLEGIVREILVICDGISGHRGWRMEEIQITRQALRVAIWNDWADVVATFVRELPAAAAVVFSLSNTCMSASQSLLMTAVARGSVAVAEKLVGMKASVGKICGRRGTTDSALVRCAAYGSTGTMMMLLRHKASVEDADESQRTALWWSANNGHVPAVAVLLRSKASVNAFDHFRNSAVHATIAAAGADVVLAKPCVRRYSEPWRAFYGCTQFAPCTAPDTLRLLLRYRASVDQPQNPTWMGGRTPLMATALMGHYSMVSVLLQHKADVNVVDSYGRTALDIASCYNRTDIVNLLQRHS